MTAFLNGRAGLGPDIDSAVRQALNEPPRIDVLPPRRTRSSSDTPVELAFRVENATREVVTITSAAGSTDEAPPRSRRAGNGHVGAARGRRRRVRVEVTGLDGTDVSDSATLTRR